MTARSTTSTALRAYQPIGVPGSEVEEREERGKPVPRRSFNTPIGHKQIGTWSLSEMD